jgi:hypothetical protein
MVKIFQEAIEGIAGTRVAHLEPDRDDGKFVLLENKLFDMWYYTNIHYVNDKIIKGIK